MKEKEKAAPEAAKEIRRGKDKKHFSDYKKVHEYFRHNTTTMFRCEVDTGIPRPYICRYVNMLRKNSDIHIIRLGRCPVSKYKGVQFLTADKTLFESKVKQPSLFDESWE